MKRRYFGTDGIRGRVGEPPITADFVLKLGWAAGCVLGRTGQGKVLIGKDTRISGYMFESALEAGLSAAGVDILLVGPLPTPGIAYLTRTLRCAAGIVISASHNPFEDNGIKFFGPDGMKLPDEVELAIEQELERAMETVGPRELGKAERVEDARGRYIEFCKSTIPAALNFRGMKVVLDCAHGAAYHVGPCVFEEYGAEVTAIGAEPDGFNINDGCGSTHPGRLAERVRECGADVGIAFDGDADRVLMVDATGRVVDGDELLYIIARSRHECGMLNGGGVVGTLMSNLGLEHALGELGIGFARAAVGDRYIMEMLRERGWSLGGESSGHLICLDRTTTGDGIVSALQVLAEMKRTGLPLQRLCERMPKYPQILRNVRVARRIDVGTNETICAAVQAAEARLAGNGRILLRPSGTEPLIRVMVEGRDAAEVERIAGELAAVVEAAVKGA